MSQSTQQVTSKPPSSDIVKELCPYGCMMLIEGPAEFVEETLQAHYEAMHQFDCDEPLPWERYEDDPFFTTGAD